MEYIYSLGGAVSAGATALRDRALVEYAWPLSRTVGGTDVGTTTPSTSGDGLYITTAGFWTTLNWQYYTSDTSATASSLISTLVGASEFVTTGRIDTNSLSTRVECSENPQRLGDLIEGIIGEGDSSGNVWKGGVYIDEDFHYEQAPTTVDYVLQNGRLFREGVSIDELSLVDPGFYVRDTNAPTGYQPPGTSNVWDDPQVSYCHEVEYVWPNLLRLKFPGQSQTIEILQEQLAGYQHPQQPIAPDVPPPAPPPTQPTPSDPPLPYTDPVPPGIPMPNIPPPDDISGGPPSQPPPPKPTDPNDTGFDPDNPFGIPDDDDDGGGNVWG
jgi:hypothetical protein